MIHRATTLILGGGFPASHTETAADVAHDCLAGELPCHLLGRDECALTWTLPRLSSLLSKVAENQVKGNCALWIAEDF
jgi:hypothetical protein